MRKWGQKNTRSGEQRPRNYSAQVISERYTYQGCIKVRRLRKPVTVRSADWGITKTTRCLICMVPLARDDATPSEVLPLFGGPLKNPGPADWLAPQREADGGIQPTVLSPLGLRSSAAMKGTLQVANSSLIPTFSL